MRPIVRRRSYDIERGPPKLPGAERGIERVLIDEGFSCRVDQTRSPLHRGERSGVDQIGVLRRRPSVQRNKITPTEQLVEAFNLHDARAPGNDHEGIVDEDGHAERQRSMANSAANLPVPDDAEGMAPEVAPDKPCALPIVL